MRTPLLRASFVPLAPLCLSLAAAAQSPFFIVRDGDEVFGIGNVQDVRGLSVANDGSWQVLVDTDNPSIDGELVLLKNGFPALVEGLFVSDPPGAQLRDMVKLSGNNVGDSALLTEYANYSSTQDTGLIFNATTVIQEGDFSIAPPGSNGWSTTTTPWQSFFVFKINDNNQAVVIGNLDDPALPSTGDQGLVLLTLDETGHLLSETVLVKELDLLPGQSPGDEVTGFATSLHQTVFNNSGQVMYFVDTDANGLIDGNVYIDDTKILQEGFFSPVSGRNYETLANSEFDMNEFGDWVIFADLSGDLVDDGAIVKNNTLVMREGDFVPGFPLYKFQTFGQAQPLFISDNKDVIYYADSDNTDTGRDQFWLINDQVLIQEGVTEADDIIIDALPFSAETAAASRNGRFLLLQVIILGNSDAVVMLDLGSISTLPDSGINAGVLEHTSGLALTGQTITVEMDEGQDVGVTPILLVSNATIAGYPPTGLITPFGELIIELAAPNPLLVLVGSAWTGEPVSFAIGVPDDPAYSGLEFFFQGIFFDVGNQSPAPAFRLTNAIKLLIGLS